jgi:hypothetical protein
MPTCYESSKGLKGKSKKSKKIGKSKDLKVSGKSVKCRSGSSGDVIPPPPPGLSGSGTGKDAKGPKLAPTFAPTQKAVASKKGGGTVTGPGIPPPPPGLSGTGTTGKDISTGSGSTSKGSKMSPPTVKPTPPPVSVKGIALGPKRPLLRA